MKVGHEVVSFPNPDFPVLYHYDHLHNTDSPSLNWMVPHWHEEIEILFFTHGSAKLYNNTVSVNPAAGEIAFISPFTMHDIRANNDYCSYHCLLVNLRLVQEARTLVAAFPPFTLVSCPEIRVTMEKLLHEFDAQEPAYGTVFRGEFLSLIGRVTRHAGFSNASANALVPQEETVKKAIAYIQEHFREKITIRQLCDLVGYEKTHFCEGFRKLTGKSVIAFINQLRCQYAYHLICTSHLNISQCAVQSGFNNVPYFTRKFHELMGFLPSETRTQGRDHE